MAPLSPAPSTLALASPALGPWFRDPGATGTPLPTLGLPAGDLSVAVSLDRGFQWLAPATSLRSYQVVTEPRSGPQRGLRAENGSQAFTTGSLVVLLTLLPEVESRLWALTGPIPSPDASPAPAAGAPARPRVRHLALEVAASSIADVVALRPADLPPQVVGDDAQAAYLGLSTIGGLANADGPPTTELLRPGTTRDVVVENRTGAALGGKLWCFDYLGRPLDAGAVANWWAYMASAGIWDNLWISGTAPAVPPASGGTIALATASVATGRTVHLVNAHEGPVEPELLGRLARADLTLVSGATALFTAGTAPSLTLGLAPPVDNAPLARIAALPLGNYAALDAATPFAGWTGSVFPASLARDFLRIAATDIERHVVGLSRTDAGQSDPRQRISPARNTAPTPVLFDVDSVTGAVMAVLTSGAAATVVSPVMDSMWGQVTTAATFGTGAAPAELQFEVEALAGEGQATDAGTSASGQSVLVHFPPGALPANCWIRLWPHAMDTATGQRFRRNGGAGAADADGQAWVVLPVPDGSTSVADDVTVPEDTSRPIRLSFDAVVLTDAMTPNYYMDQRFDRPDVVPGSRIALASDGSSPSGFNLWIPEQGAPFARGTGQYASGQHLVGLPVDDSDAAESSPALVDLTTLVAADVAAANLLNSAGTGDALITTTPAFAQTPAGDLAVGPNGSTWLNRTRDGLNDLPVMGRPAPSQERREVLALERTGNTAVIGSAPGRASHHESPQSWLGFPGVPAAAEVHGPGIALAGPATDRLFRLAAERRATDLMGYVQAAATALNPAPDPGGTTTWTAVLETTTFGVVGDALVRALVALEPGFTPGKTWVELKNEVEGALGINVDPWIDSATFDDDYLAGSLDSVILKTRDGARQFATSLLAAIGRAEDLIYIATPAIDPYSADAGAIDVVGALAARLAEQPGLHVILNVPGKFLPDQTAKLDAVRSAGISAAWLELVAAGGDRVAMFSPLAGPGRPSYSAATTVIVDDALLLTGTTHLWRRGLTFDSSLAVGLFDENVAFGRPAAVRAARVNLLARGLGIAPALVPDDPAGCVSAIRRLVAVGGHGRVAPNPYAAAADQTSVDDRNVWNPDGTPEGSSTSWHLWFAGVSGSTATELINAIR